MKAKGMLKPMQKEAKPVMEAKEIPTKTREAKPEMKTKEIPRPMQKEAQPEVKAKGRPRSAQKEAKLRVRLCAWGLTCPGAV